MFRPTSLAISCLLHLIGANLVKDCINRELVNPWDLKESGEDFIHLAMIISGGEEDIEHFTSKADRLLETVLSTSKGGAIHLIFITEESSVPTIARHVESALARALRERILFNSETWKLVKGRSFRIPRLRVEFVSMEAITLRHRAEMEEMKKHFNNYNDWYTMKGDPQWAWMPAAKYNHDLFYLR